MTKWTTQNTEEFTQSELDVMNDAIDTISGKLPNDDDLEFWINDAINNAWLPGMSSKQLVAAVLEARKIG